MAKQQSKPSIQERLYWGRKHYVLPELDFLSVQHDSYRKFLEEGITELIAEVSPVSDFTGKNWELTLGQFTFGKPKYSAELAVAKGVTYDMPIRIAFYSSSLVSLTLRTSTEKARRAPRKE